MVNCLSCYLIHAGFLSIDCGLPNGSDYRENFTGLYYKSDADLIDSGESIRLSSSLIGDGLLKHLETVRSFPEREKNCYTIKPFRGKGSKYLIRASFMYGNYDSLNQLPTFDLDLGPDTWSTIAFEDSFKVVRKEILHILSSDYVHICLVKTGSTMPFISALELRPLNSSMYPIDAGSLLTFGHIDCDSTRGNAVIR